MSDLPAPGGDSGVIRRRVIGLALILLVAGAVAWWGATREDQRATEIQTFIKQICSALARGEDGSREYQGTPDIVAEQITARLTTFFASTPDAIDLLDVDVRTGTAEERGGRHVTHIAMLNIGDTPVLGLQVRHLDTPDTIMITGYWEP